MILYYQNVTNLEFTTTDNLSLHHAKDHLEVFQQDINQEIQKQATTEALSE